MKNRIPLSNHLSGWLLTALMVCMFSKSLWAKNFDIDHPLRDFELAVADNPREVKTWIEGFLSQTDSEMKPHHWAKAVIIEHYASSLLTEQRSTKSRYESLQKALKKAQTLHLVEETIILMLMQNSKGLDESTAAVDEQSHLDAIALARSSGNSRLLVRALADTAGFFHNEKGSNAEALRYYREAQNIMKNVIDFDPLEAAMTQVKIGLMLDENDMGGERTISVYLQILKQFESLHLRQFQVIMLYNIANSYRDLMGRNEESKRYFRKVLQLCPEIEDWSTYAQSLANLADFDADENHFSDAEWKLNEAQRIIKGRDSVAYAEILVNYVVSLYKKQKRYENALATLREAESILPPNAVDLRDRIASLKPALFAHIGLYRDAYESLNSYFRSYRTTKEQQEKDDFEKLKVELGLSVEEQKSQTLKAENQLQAQELRLAQGIKLVAALLALCLIATVGSMIFAISRGKQVRLSNEKMQTILQTIDEGILSISRDLTIIDEHSPFIQKLFPQQRISGESVVDAILKKGRLSPEELSIATEALRACLGEDPIAWEFNSIHLPQHMQLLDSAYVHLHWQPMVEHGRIEKILLAIRDVTAKRLLEDKLEQQQSRVVRLQRKMSELLNTRFQDSKKLLERLISQKGQLGSYLHPDTPPPLDLLRQLHTAKGEARSLGLKELSQTLHQLEDALASRHSKSFELDLERYSEQLTEYQYLIRDVFSLQPSHSHRVDQFFEILAPSTNALRHQLQEAGLDWQGLEVFDYIPHWPEEILNVVGACLVHVLANAADHGYILPKQRGYKVGKAWFQIVAQPRPGGIRLTIRDQGKGLDLNQLASLARERGFTPLGSETIADIVFVDGASTAEKLSETSGRGIGLSAVRALCRQTGGDAWFRSNDQGQGAMLVLDFNFLEPSDSQPPTMPLAAV